MFSLSVKQKDSIFHSESSFAAQTLVRQFLNLSNCNSLDLQDESLRFEDVHDTLELLFDQFDFVVSSLKIEPVFKKHLEEFDEVLKMVVNLLHIMNKIQETEEQRKQLIRIAVKLIKYDPRTSQGDSLLHLVVSTSSTMKTFDLNTEKLFPNYEMACLLLECGADPNTSNKLKNAPLHLACTRPNYDKRIVDLLLDNGAHLDQSNFNGNQPLKQLLSIKESKIEPLKYISLKCLAARKLHQIYSSHKEFKHSEAGFLQDFVNIH